MGILSTGRGLRDLRRISAGFKLGTKGKGSWFRVRRVIKKANVVLEVLDSRDPLGTRNTVVEGLIKALRKRLLLVLNKSDLVPKTVLERWVEHFESLGCAVLTVSAKKRGDMEILRRAAKRLGGGERAIIAVVGYPNVGKSAIINGLKGRRVADTSPVPGHTRGERLVRVDEDLLVVDTPGLLPARRLSVQGLVLRGFIAPEKLENPLTPAMRFLEEVMGSMPILLEETYGVGADDPYRFLELLAVKRGFLLKGGELNVDEAARTILRDWQSGKLKFYRVLER